MKFNLTVPDNFNFLRTVYSHGWCSLPPFKVKKETRQLQRVIELSSGRILIAEIIQSSAGRLTVDILQNNSLSMTDKKEIIDQLKSCLRLDEDFLEFYSQAKRHKEFVWIPRKGAGRMLRAPTVFEDVVKMICTTNCSWALTEIMIQNFCTNLGTEVAGGLFAFPQPEAIADQTEKFLRKKIRAGYRAPYLLELSQRLVNKEINLESWRQSTIPTDELFDEVRSVKGIGPYAAGNILKLLGRYDYLGIDSWCRKQFSARHKQGRKVNDKAIEKFYKPYGIWKGLFFWLDVTKHWYDKHFPF